MSPYDFRKSQISVHCIKYSIVYAIVSARVPKEGGCALESGTFESVVCPCLVMLRNKEKPLQKVVGNLDILPLCSPGKLLGKVEPPLIFMTGTPRRSHLRGSELRVGVALGNVGSH